MRARKAAVPLAADKRADRIASQYPLSGNDLSDAKSGRSCDDRIRKSYKSPLKLTHEFRAQSRLINSATSVQAAPDSR